MDHVPAAEAVIDFELDQDSVELLDTDVTPEELDRDPEFDSVTHGLTLRLHRTGHWHVLIHGTHHRFFADFEDARAYLEAAERDWQEMGLPAHDERRDAFTGHPAQEGE